MVLSAHYILHILYDKQHLLGLHACQAIIDDYKYVTNEWNDERAAALEDVG